jgi:hypothetical protein
MKAKEKEETSSLKGFGRTSFNTLLLYDDRERNRLGKVYNAGGEMREIALFQLLP